MTVNLPAVLVTATFITGTIWALDRLLLAPKRRARMAALAGQSEAEIEAAGKEPAIVEMSRSFFPIILAVLVIRSFLAEPFRIPSQSMMPTLLVGDFILVNKFAYGLRLPVTNTKVVELGEPKRGDIIVFRYPEDPRVDYIKRVIGAPGDQIVYRDKVLYINGQIVPQQPDGAYLGEGSGASMTGASRRLERLENINHRVLVWPEVADHIVEFTVPKGEYFVMGDNRDNSKDSRVWGTVPDKNLVGKAFLIWWNIDCANQGIFSCIAHAGSNTGWDRIGSRVH
jgi:signal peptidase I